MASTTAVIFDVDPLVASADKASCSQLHGTLDLLKAKEIPFRFLTNDSLRSTEEVIALMGSLGLDADGELIQPASSFVARWISERTPRATVYLMGSEAARLHMESCGLRVIDHPEEIGYLCDYIVTGAYPGFSYEALRNALECSQMDATVVAIDREPVVPGSEDLPGGGPTAAALKAMFRKEPAFTGGMPNHEWIKSVAASLGVEPAQCLVVGDARRSPESAAREAGVPVVVVGSDKSGEQPAGAKGAQASSGSGDESGTEVAYLPHYGALVKYIEGRL